MDKEPPITLDALLRHSDWVRHIARSMTFGENEVDDVVQQTWLQALRKPPVHAESIKGWLATVVRNVVRRRLEGDTRRRLVEESSAKPRSELSTDSRVQMIELQREICDAVLSLEEPYQRVIILRYFESLSAVQVAKRLGCPLETVRTRLKRALVRLRAQMDNKHDGNRLRWMSVSAVWLREVPVAGTLSGSVLGSGTVLLGSIVVTTSFKIACGVMLAAVAGFFAWPSSPPDVKDLIAVLPSEKIGNTESAQHSPELERREILEPSEITKAPEPSTETPSESLKDILTEENMYGHGVGWNESPEFQNAVNELKANSLNVDRFAQYLADSLKEAFVLRDSASMKIYQEKGMRKSTSGGLLIYESTPGEHTAAPFNAYRDESRLESAYLLMGVPGFSVEGVEQGQSSANIRVRFDSEGESGSLNARIYLAVTPSGGSYSPGDEEGKAHTHIRLKENAKIVDDLYQRGEFGGIARLILDQENPRYGTVPFSTSERDSTYLINTPLAPHTVENFLMIFQRLGEHGPINLEK